MTDKELDNNLEVNRNNSSTSCKVVKDLTQKNKMFSISSPERPQLTEIIFKSHQYLSPEIHPMNQKFFPSKEKYFGKKPKRSISPFNNNQNLNCYSPKENNILSLENYLYANTNKNSPMFSPHYSASDQNFDCSPGNIFVNFNNGRRANNSENNEKSLQEKIESLQKTDANDFIVGKESIKSFNCNDENDNDNEEEVYTLSFEDDKKFIEKKNIYRDQILQNIFQKNNTNNDNDNDNVNNNKTVKEKSEITSEKSEKNENNDNKFDNSKEFQKPYIPSNNMYYMNNTMNNSYKTNNITNDNIQPENSNFNLKINQMNNAIFNYHNYNLLNIYSYQNNLLPFYNVNLNNSNNLNNNSNNINKNYFMYRDEKYEISQNKKHNKKHVDKISKIDESDTVYVFTQKNKKIKRIDPNIYINESIDYLAYNIFLLAKDQAGCRFLQEKIDKDPSAAEIFYNAILPYVIPLSKDAFGNYLIQKLCDKINQTQIKKLLEIMSNNILDIGSNSYGTRVIQYMIDFLKTKELLEFFYTIIKPFIIPILKELHGTHIINKFVDKFPQYVPEINKIIIDNCSLLANHKHGCCILQKKIIEGKDTNFKNELINNLLNNCIVLIVDKFGNYVIQTILLLNDSNINSIIVKKICENLPFYSKHTYGVNVIEKCFDMCKKEDRQLIIDKIKHPEIISELIVNEYGNYVVQKALSFADEKDREIIMNYIIPLTPKIKEVKFGEKLLFKLTKYYQPLANYLNSNLNNENNNIPDKNFQIKSNEKITSNHVSDCNKKLNENNLNNIIENIYLGMNNNDEQLRTNNNNFEKMN